MTMSPLYFGRAGERLFGVYHASATATARRTGVVLCAPFGHEYIRAHRSLRQLAIQLASRGYHAFRFDYFGCGDSEGEGEDATAARWLCDIESAIDELRGIAGVQRCCLVGLRFGGTMAAEVASRRSDVEAAILWDPVGSGRAYLRAMARLQRRWLWGRPGSHLFAMRPDVPELIGFPAPLTLRQSMAQLALAGAPDGSPRRIAITDPDSDWESPAVVHSALLRPAMIQRVAAAVEEHAP